VFDVDRNMQLHYNTRNLPLDIVFDEGLIRNSYRPDGVKTNKKVYDGKGRLTTNETYLGSLVLNFGVPSQILHPEGVVDVSNLSQPVVHYHLKDHLGNVRVVVNPSATKTALISQTNDYYPFGMCYTKNPGSFTNNRKYNGKEEQEMPGRWLDYGARFYDPQLGRWHGVDPLAKDYAEWSPYNYATDDPVNKLDPDGKWVWAVVGAALDYGLQVYDNYQNGSTGSDAWVGDVNFVSVGLSALNPSGKFKVLKTAVVEVVKAATEKSSLNDGFQINTDIKDVAKKATINTVVDVGAGKLTEAGSTKAVQNAKNEVSAANKQLKTAERQAQRSPGSTKKAERVQSAQSNAQLAKNKEVRTQMLNSTVGKAPNATQQAAKTTTDRIQKNEEKR
jgi:RHS repeat-associated protein